MIEKSDRCTRSYSIDKASLNPVVTICCSTQTSVVVCNSTLVCFCSISRVAHCFIHSLIKRRQMCVLRHSKLQQMPSKKQTNSIIGAAKKG